MTEPQPSTSPSPSPGAASISADDQATVIRVGGYAQSASRSANVAGAGSVNQPEGPALFSEQVDPSETVPLPIGTELHKKFKIERLLGSGGFAVVYLALHKSLKRRVAVKEYMPSAIARRHGTSQVVVNGSRHREIFDAGLKSFVNEAELLAKFDHPSIVFVHDFWEQNGTAYMAMTYYEGETLKDRLKRVGTPSEKWLLELLGPLTAALQVLHDENCYHRDIAPDNIMLLKDSNQPVLLDFGAARRVMEEVANGLTVLLKPGFAPLEQYGATSTDRQGPWTDVYALAAVVYFAITGKCPKVSPERSLDNEETSRRESAAVKANGRYSPEFLAAIDDALAVRPADRTPSIGQFCVNIGLENPATRSDKLKRRARKVDVSSLFDNPKRWVLVAATATVAFVIVGVVVAKYLPRDTAVQTAAVSAPASTSAVPATIYEPTSPLSVTSEPHSVTPPSAAAPEFPAPAPTLSPTSPPTAAQTAEFSVSAEFDRAVRAQSADFRVTVSPSKPELRIGRDKLRFSVASSRSGWLAVFVLGPDGSLNRLIPINETPPRITAGLELTLPSAGDSVEVGEPAGRQDFLVVVTSQRRKLKISGAHMDREDGVFVLPTGATLAEQVGKATLQQGSILTGEPDVKCHSADCWEYGAARFSISVVR